jgi:hypothetical protein
MIKRLNSNFVAPTPTQTTKTIKNYSLQGLSLVIQNGADYETVWLEPKKSITLLESQITDQIVNLHKRRLLQIVN